MIWLIASVTPVVGNHGAVTGAAVLILNHGWQAEFSVWEWNVLRQIIMHWQRVVCDCSAAFRVFLGGLPARICRSHAAFSSSPHGKACPSMLSLLRTCVKRASDLVLPVFG